jgi:hypothetical protein
VGTSPLPGENGKDNHRPCGIACGQWYTQEDKAKVVIWSRRWRAYFLRLRREGTLNGRLSGGK